MTDALNDKTKQIQIEFSDIIILLQATFPLLLLAINHEHYQLVTLIAGNEHNNPFKAATAGRLL